MNLTSAVTGLPYVGKTTLFNLLTGARAATGAYAGAEAETNVGVAKIGDDRVNRLAEVLGVKKKVYAEAAYRDIGLTHGSGGDEVSARRLGELRNADALVHVVRAFRDPNVPHVDGSVDPLRDMAALDLELLVADHGLVERRLERLAPELRGARPDERAAKERERVVLEKALATLDAQTPLRDLALDPEDLRLVSGFRFLTLLPQLVVANIDEEDVADPEPVLAPLRAMAARHRQMAVVAVCAKLEAEIAELPPAEAAAFRVDLGLPQPAKDRVLRATYELLGLITFLTGNKEEVRAWAIPEGATAQQAAGAIHSDLERGFIRAEVMRWDDLVRAGSEAAARVQGLLRTEGRDYVVGEGDVLRVLFKV